MRTPPGDPPSSRVADATDTSGSARIVAPLKLWRSLEELNGEGKRSRPQLPAHLAATLDPINRSQFLKLMGGSLALAGLTACAAEPKGPPHIAPYVTRPEGISEATSLYYATALTQQGYATGVLVRQMSGRPLKVEGNPQHPASLGATTIFEQAAMLVFYDPDRSQVVTSKGQASAWNDAAAALASAANAQRGKQGGGLRILTETVTSPSLTDQIQTLLRTFPQARWHQWEPINRDNAAEGGRLAFGQPVEVRYDLSGADVIVTLDSDVLNLGPGSVRYAHDFAANRQITPTRATQSRLYAIESTPSVTGMVADHRLPVKARDVQAVAQAIAAGAGVAGASGTLPAGVDQGWIAALVADLKAHGGRSIVIAGDAQPPAVHVLAYQINQTLGNLGKTELITDPVAFSPTSQTQSLRDLVGAMNGGAVDFVLIVGGNPAFTAPADLGFAQALGKVAQSVHLSLYQDETSALTTWHVPLAHELESWGDARAYDGTVTLLQPLINPLYGGKTPQQVLAALSGQGSASAHDLVKGFWQRQLDNPPDFEARWRRALNDGTVPDTALPPKQVNLAAAPGPAAPAPAAATGLEVIFRPDPTIYDGRYANNGWLQELPKPLSKHTWDNVAALGPGTAQRLGVQTGDVLTLTLGNATVNAPALVSPGHPEDSITAYLGYGRTRAGRVGTGIGYNAYALRTAAAPWFGSGLSVARTGQTYPLATTQGTQDMEGRELVLGGTLAEYQKDPAFVSKDATKPVGSLYPPFPYPAYKWGMAIDLTSCIGCGACAMACVAENNIPVVGKDQVARGRQMHWIRVDRYYQGSAANPTSYAMPVPCMQCENAPCELVCPVDATTHSDEGLNDMVYNRCVGTRYCSNNCPYKVRRFNFYQFADYTTPSLQLLNNPDVTVRERGVMEKCTYCVQRITHARVRAEIEGRKIADGEVKTACQAVCPTQAIVFGDLNDPKSRVAQLKADGRNYDLLAELNTRPRTSYLGAIRNPNSQIKEA